MATVNLDVKLEDAGLLVLTQDAQVTATEYPAHTVKNAHQHFGDGAHYLVHHYRIFYT